MSLENYLIFLVVSCAILAVTSGRATEIEMDPFGGDRINEYNIYLTIISTSIGSGVFCLLKIYQAAHDYVRLGLSLSHDTQETDAK